MTIPRRGEIWAYASALSRRPDGTPTPDLRLIVSTDALTAVPDLPVVLALAVLDHDPGGLLAVDLGGGRWASAVTLAPARRLALTSRVDTLDPDTMDRIGAALRAALDL